MSHKMFIFIRTKEFIVTRDFVSVWLAYFCYYSWVPLYFFVLFMDPTVLFMDPTILFQLTFTFIYSTFSKKNFSFSKISGSQIDLSYSLYV